MDKDEKRRRLLSAIWNFILSVITIGTLWLAAAFFNWATILDQPTTIEIGGETNSSGPFKSASACLTVAIILILISLTTSFTVKRRFRH